MSELNLMRQTNRTCLSFWFPRLQKWKRMMPETEIVHTDLNMIYTCTNDPAPEGWHEQYEALVESIATAADKLGYPCFLRTGHTSGKHGYLDTCHVPDRASIAARIRNLVEYSEMADLIGLPTSVWVVRKMLALESAFTAFNGLPIAREFRAFAENGKLIGIMPYWPADAIDDHATGDEWKEALSRQNTLVSAEREHLAKTARAMSKVLPGPYSIDFAQSINSKWWMIDAAEAEKSYGWDEIRKTGGVK